MNATVPRIRYVVFLVIAIGGCGLDLWTKHWIFGRLGMPDGETIWLWKPYFSLATSLNEGALFGWGQGKGVLFSCLSVVAALGVVYWLFVGQAARDRWLTIALACVMAGIFGNLYDRLGLPGLLWGDFAQELHKPNDPVYAVRDWIHFQIPEVFDWPVFNVADSLLVVGAALLVWYAFRAEMEAPKVASQPPLASESAADAHERASESTSD